MNMNAFFKKLWQAREEAEAQEQKIRDQEEEQDRKDADAKAKAREEEEAERRAAAAEAAEVEDSIQREADEDRAREDLDEVERPLPQQEQEVGGERWPDLDPSPTYKDGIDVIFDEDREQEEQDRATFADGSPVTFDYRGRAQAPREVEDAGHSASEVADGESYRATYLREIDDESRARMRYEREQEAAGVVLGNELEDQYVEQATREWIGEGEQAPAQEVTGLEQPVPEPSQNPVPAPAPSQAADLDDDLEME